MSGITFTVPEEELNLKPRITVVGIGGAGGNAVNNMIGAELEGCDFVIANTDAQALSQNSAERRIQLGRAITQGLGAGARPETGYKAAEESLDEIRAQLDGSHMVFITAGMGGGTGTGAAPVIARVAKELDILTVGVVTKPFHFEGTRRMRTAERGIEQLQDYVDTLIIIPNQNLFRVANEKTTFADAFKMADDVLHNGVRSVTDLMMVPGLVNLDFADIRTVMGEMGKAMMGAGEAEGERRALEAAEAAIANPLLEDASMKGARAVLINITGGMDMALYEVDEAATRIREEVDPDANIIFGSTFDPSMEGKLRVSVVATGIDADEMRKPKPTMISLADAQPEAQTGTAAPAATGVPGAGADAVAARAAVSDNVADLGPHFATAASAEPASPSVTNDTGRVETFQLGQTVARAETAPAPPRSSEAPIAEQAPRSTPAEDLPFVAPRPAMPGDVTETPAKDAAPEQPARRRSIFERAKGMLGGPRDDQAPAAAQQTEMPLEAPQETIHADPADRPRLSRDDDELLEIPAFLRRQAN